jgi:hypothetical protein
MPINGEFLPPDRVKIIGGDMVHVWELKHCFAFRDTSPHALRILGGDQYPQVPTASGSHRLRSVLSGS